MTARLLARLGDYTLAFCTCTVALLAESWKWLRLSRRCSHQALPMSDGTVCALCGKFEPWHTSARCRECGSFL